jgi:hypothetical protein
MSARAYLLLDIVDGNYEYAVQMLRGRAGVVFVDLLEGYPDIIAMVEAPDRQRLAKFIMPVIGCIDGITEDLHLLVTRDKELTPDLPTSNNSRPYKRTIRKCKHREKEISKTTSVMFRG